MVYGSHDLFYVVEIPAGWEYRNEEGSNEITISKDDVSVSVAVVDAEIGNTVETLLEARKKLLLERCPSAELHEETTQAVAGVAGRSLTMYCAGPSAPTTVRVSASMQYWKFFVFYVTCPTAKWSEMQPIVDRMARSFRHGDGLPEGRAERMRPSEAWPAPAIDKKIEVNAAPGIARVAEQSSRTRQRRNHDR